MNLTTELVKYQINASIQIVPIGNPESAYRMIDEAINVIRASGLRFMVTPMETVIEGPYDEVMEVIKNAQQIVLDTGAEEVVAHIKVHMIKSRNVTFEEKTGKWQN